MLIAAASVLSLVGFFLLSAVLPRERLRGVVASIVVCAQFVGWSLVVPLPIRNAVIVASLLLLVLSALSPRTQPARRTPILPLCVAFFACTLVTTAITNPDGAGLIGRIGSFSCLLVVVVTQFSSKDAQAFRDGIVATAGLQAVFGLIEFFVTHAPVLWGYKVYANGRASYNENPLLGDTVLRIQGTTSHWIPFAALLTVGLLVLLTEWSRYRPALRVAIIAAFTLCLVLAGARSVFLAAAVAVVYLSFTSNSLSARGRNLLLLAGGAVAAVAYSSSIVSYVDDLLGSGSFSNRSGNLEYVPRLLLRSASEVIWGSGGDTEPQLFTQGLLFQNGFDVVDNQLVTTLATQGVIGLALLVSLFIVGFRTTGRLSRSVLLVMVVMLFSFDYLRFTSMLGLLFGFLALAPATAGARENRPSDIVETGPEPRVPSPCG